MQALRTGHLSVMLCSKLTGTGLVHIISARHVYAPMHGIPSIVDVNVHNDTTVVMTSELNPEDLDLLVESVKDRQKFPRTFARSLRAVTEADPETTERIFYDSGGPSGWAAYVLTKRSAANTGHVSGKGRRQRLIARLEEQTAESRRALARQLAMALESDRARIERVLETIVQHARRSRYHRRQSSMESSGADNRLDTPDTLAVASSTRTLGLPRSISATSMRDAAEYFSEHWHVLTNASVSECIRIFPTYLAGAIKRYTQQDNTDAVVAAVSITLPYCGWTGCLMRIEVVSSKIDHLARELFGVHLEVDDGFRYIYLPGGSRVAPDPRLALRDCRLGLLRQIFGSPVADAILATQMCQRDMKEGRDYTSCVSMVIPSAMDGTAKIYALLRLKDGALLRDRLFS